MTQQKKWDIKYSRGFIEKFVRITEHISLTYQNETAAQDFAKIVDEIIVKRSEMPTSFAKQKSHGGNEFYSIVFRRKWVIYYVVVDDRMLVFDISYYSMGEIG